VLSSLHQSILLQTSASSGNIAEPESPKGESRFERVRLHAVLSLIPDIIMEVDGNKTYTWVNRARLEFSGDDVLGIDGVIAEVRRLCVF